MHPDFLVGFEDHYYIYPRTPDNEKRDILWNHFETNLANINEDVIIEDGVNIDLDLESGDVGIEDTMYEFLYQEYEYINCLSKYLKEWVRTIGIRDCLPRTSMIARHSEGFFITFNYTATLETVYKIPENKILHIHGSLRNHTPDPIIGHGNLRRIKDINLEIEEADKIYDEKRLSVCKVVRDYYETTLKDVKRYIPSLSWVSKINFEEIIVLGLSLEGVDMPYFRCIDILTGNKLVWKIYCHQEDEGPKKKQILVKEGIQADRINLLKASDFFDLQDDELAREYFKKINYCF